jgi:hypothetical protein
MISALLRLFHRYGLRGRKEAAPAPAGHALGLDRDRESWDESLADQLVGSFVLIGLTRLDPAGELIEHEQFYGYVTCAHKTRGITLKLEGNRIGETFNLPPDTRAFQRARLGRYRLKSTGEIVVDPDFTSSWTARGRHNA